MKNIPENTPEEKLDELYKNSDYALHSLKTELRMFGDTIDCATDVSDVIDELDETVIKAKLKQYEMELITYIAFHCDDAAIVDLRKNIFGITKIIYATEIQKSLEEMKARLKSRSSDCDYSALGVCSSTDMRTKFASAMRNYTHDFIDHWYNWFKKQICIGRAVRKNIKKGKNNG